MKFHVAFLLICSVSVTFSSTDSEISEHQELENEHEWIITRSNRETCVEEYASCFSSKKEGDKCCYVGRNPNSGVGSGVCTVVYSLVILDNGKKQTALTNTYLGCYPPTPGSRHNIPEAELSFERKAGSCVKRENNFCPPGYKVGQKCCYLTGSKKNPGICAMANALNILQRSGLVPITVSYVGCFNPNLFTG